MKNIDKKIEDVKTQLMILKRESENGYCNLDAQQEISYLERKLYGLLKKAKDKDGE